jgi:predicted DNA-binding transcriptional regulator AlpA
MVTTERPVVCNISELAKMAGVSEGLLYTKANQGKFPGCRRIGKRFVCHVDTFLDYLRSGTGDDCAERR